MNSDKLRKIFESDDLGLLDVSKRDKPQTSSDRLESSFLEIVDFYSEYGKEPSAKTTNMAERRLGVRLRGIRADDEKVEALKHLDLHGLLVPEEPLESIDQVFNDDALGLFDDPTGILTLKNVPSGFDRSKSDYIAKRQRAADFKQFETLFQEQHHNLQNGTLKLVKFSGADTIKQGRFFITDGVMVYIADIGEKTIVYGRPKERIHCIFENGTESHMFLRSLASQLYEEGGYSVVSSDDAIIVDDDMETGYIYVLSSLSENPKVANISNLFKIGFSTTSVEQRVKNAVNDPTYLMAPVKIVATYKAFNMNTQKFELLLHRVFSEVRLGMNVVDINSSQRAPSEWFIVPLDVIDTAIRMIISGDIVNYRYDTDSKTLVDTNE
jgi:hypothetical protein